MSKEKVQAQAELDQALAGLREKMEDIRQLKDWLFNQRTEHLLPGQKLALSLQRICVRAVWLQLETSQCNIDEASYLENRSLRNLRSWFSNPERLKELQADGGELANEIQQLINLGG